MNPIYLDHAAGTSILPEVKTLVAAYAYFGNPSSSHALGIAAKGEIDSVRVLCRDIFRVGLDQVLFTSGATESIHLAIIGSFLGREPDDVRKKVLVSPLCHSCIWNALAFLSEFFDVEVVYLPLDSEGLIVTESITEDLLSDVFMVVVEHGNSEFGHLQPVAKIGKRILRSASDLEKVRRPLFLVDAAASAVTEKLSLEHQKCDLLVLSAEKIGGIAGAGLLIKHESVRLQVIQGGSQEFGYRGGTENTLGIMALGKALEQKELQRGTDRIHLKELNLWLRKELESLDLDLVISTPKESFLPHVLHFFLPEKQGSLMVQKADLAGFCISSGSACSSGSVEVSKAHKILSKKLELEPLSGIRLSFSSETTKEELEAFIVWLQTVMK